MFTGIIEETGKILNIILNSTGGKIKIAGKTVPRGVKIGDSVAVSGVCLTVTSIQNNHFTADISRETLKKTLIGRFKSGETVNLERAMALGDRMGGHIVQGHVEGIGRVVSVKKSRDSYLIRISADENILSNTQEKGSVTVNGISLTAFSIDSSGFTCAVIPHTFENTDLKYKKPGDEVNLESDIISKIILKKSSLVNSGSKEKSARKGLTAELLMENGFI